MTKVKNYLLGYEDMYIMQDTEYFNFSLDSVLLANFVTINKKIQRVLDIGCGNAPIPLILSTRTKSPIDGVEIQKDLYELAFESVEINKLNEQIKIINADINDIYDKIESDSYDVITCNPPYFKYSETSNINVSKHKTIARHELMLDIKRVCKVSRKLLKNGAVLALVHRPERLIEIIEEMKKSGIEPKRVKFIYPKVGKEANILLIEGVKNGKPGLKVEAPIYTHDSFGEYTEEIKRYFE
jgi:tRNA1(Val) A37 N6-methylase TrmN6